MDSIEQLLAQVKAQYGGATPPSAPPVPASNAPISPPSAPPPPPRSRSPQDPIDSLLSEVKGQYETLDAAAQEAQRQQLEAERQRQVQLQQARRAALSRTAQDWLKKLDPLSTEGLWFNQFAEQYPSRLEAALDYLSALEAEP